MRTHVTLDSMGALVEGVHNNPFELLGPHPIQQDGRSALAVRAYLPDTQQAWVLDPAHAESRPMRRIHPAGLFEAICPVPEHASQRYQFRVAGNDGEVTTMHDPYSFSSHLTDFDFYLFGQGRHERIYDKLGAQLRTVDGVTGTNFAVWAPNATAISVVGEFNRWDTRRHPMRKHIPSGIWELFVPEVGAGQQYKFRVRLSDGGVIDKTDPYGFAAELPPRTASIVADLSRYAWNDQAWMEQRRSRDTLNQPISMYEVHLGSWQRSSDQLHGWLNYRDLARRLVDYCHQMGYTHIELLADQRASVHRQLGISDGGLLCGHEPLRHARGLHVLRGLLPSQRHRRDPGLGAGPFPTRRPWVATFRWHGVIRTRRSSAGRASRLGHDDLQLRPQRGPQFPGRQRVVLAGQIPH